MSSCAACQTPFTKERRGLKCTLCDERRIAEPAYYCDRACQKTHWPAHKAFHARLADEQSRSIEGRTADDLVGAAERMASADPRYSIIGQGDKARLEGDFRQAAKLYNKVIRMHPAYPVAYVGLGLAHMESRDYDKAVPQFMKAMELSDTGTDWAPITIADVCWAQAASNLFVTLGQQGVGKRAAKMHAPKLDWYSDIQQIKRMAERAVAALPDGSNEAALQMRSFAYSSPSDPSADDLRKALRDLRRVVELSKEASTAGALEILARRICRLESLLRKRITADLAALRLDPQ